MDILVTICARGGSKGIPGKNVKMLNGKPLIAYTIKSAVDFANLYDADIELSTDDKEIKETAYNYDLKTDYKRPAKLATDDAGKLAVIKHLLDYKEEKKDTKYDIILDLDVTSPLRTLKDLKEAFAELREREDALNIFSVSPASRNPYFNMVEEKEDGFVRLVKNRNNYKTRQEAPQVYDMNASFYFYKRNFFEENYSIATTDKSLAYVVPHTCFDLDHKIDFQFMEYLLSEDLLDFEI